MILLILHSEKGSRSKRDHTTASRILQWYSCIIHIQNMPKLWVLHSFLLPKWIITALSWHHYVFKVKLSHKKWSAKCIPHSTTSSLLVLHTFWLMSLLIDRQSSDFSGPSIHHAPVHHPSVVGKLFCVVTDWFNGRGRFVVTVVVGIEWVVWLGMSHCYCAQ